MKVNGIQLSLPHLFLAAAVAGMIGFAVGAVVNDSKATSEESHIVFNYITANANSPEMVRRFNEINGDWPPSRNKLSNLLLEAHRQAGH